MTTIEQQHLAADQFPTEPVALDNLSVKFMQESGFMPLELDNGTLSIVMANPDDFSVIDALKYAYDLDVQVFKGNESDILDAFEIGDDIEPDVNYLKDLASEAPIIRLVNRLILKAIESRASDIHFEPFENAFKVRFRIDGVLQNIESPPNRLQAAIISRIKIMANLDIAERRLPQDGRIKLKITNREIDFRVSTIPTLFGESVVMRVLDREMLILDLEKIGFPHQMLEAFVNMIHQPYGMILVTGPTGSGKTSTLYTTLAKINSPEKKIITLEDPVEYYLSGINQIQVKPKIGMTFANGLRSIVRQDPDIILVGEIRDKETAEIAVQSALTGHLIFSTLHTNDSVGAISRLLDMGVEGFLLSSTLLGILAQRLVRVICPHCKTPIEPDPKLLNSIGATSEEISNLTLYAGKGCEACRHSGFLGRTAIFEYLPVDAMIRKEINRGSDSETLKQRAAELGMKSLRQNGWEQVKQGITTIPEILRVTLEK
jgi:general secretion pathway protein E